MRCEYCNDATRSLPCPECYPGDEFREVLTDIRRIGAPSAYRYVTWYKRAHEKPRYYGQKYYWSKEPWAPKKLSIPEGFGEGVL